MIGFYAAGAMGQGGVPPSGITLLDIAQTTESTTSTSHTIALPSTVLAGELLVLIVTCRSNSGNNLGLSTPTGWTKVDEEGSGGPGIGTQTPVAVYYRSADGSEGGSAINLSSPMPSTMAAQVHRLSGGGSASVTFAVGASSPFADPPMHTSSGGSGDIYWIAGFGSNGSASPVNYSPDFDDAQTTTASGGSPPCRVISSAMISATNPVNPGNIDMAVNTNSASFTISVPG